MVAPLGKRMTVFTMTTSWPSSLSLYIKYSVYCLTAILSCTQQPNRPDITHACRLTPLKKKYQFILTYQVYDSTFQIDDAY